MYKSETKFTNSFIICGLSVMVGIDKNNNFVIFLQTAVYMKNKWVTKIEI